MLYEIEFFNPLDADATNDYSVQIVEGPDTLTDGFIAAIQKLADAHRYGSITISNYRPMLIDEAGNVINVACSSTLMDSERNR